MTFDEKITAMQSARALAERAFVEAVAPARDAYVVAGQAHVAAETAWLEAPASDEAAAAAAATWAEVITLREQLMVDAGEAAAASAASLVAAWETIRAEA